MADQTIRCRDCPTEFVFTEGEQAFYAQNNFQPPKRCKPCRDARKQNRDQASAPQNMPPPEHEDRPRGRRKGGRRDNDY